jgi:hypothetical protein
LRETLLPYYPYVQTLGLDKLTLLNPMDQLAMNKIRLIPDLGNPGREVLRFPASARKIDAKTKRKKNGVDQNRPRVLGSVSHLLSTLRRQKTWSKFKSTSTTASTSAPTSVSNDVHRNNDVSTFV